MRKQEIHTIFRWETFEEHHVGEYTWIEEYRDLRIWAGLNWRRIESNSWLYVHGKELYGP
jgi:hypothetical protein